MGEKPDEAGSRFETCEQDFVDDDCDQPGKRNAHRVLVKHRHTNQSQSEQNEIDGNTEDRRIACGC